MRKIKTTTELISELNKIEEDRIKNEDKQKEINKRIQLEEEEKIKKQNEIFKERIEKLKTQSINIDTNEISNNVDNIITSKIDISKEIYFKNNVANNSKEKNKILIGSMSSLFIGAVISFLFLLNINQDDGVVLKIERPKILVLTEIIEKEIIVEKEVKQVSNTKPQVTKQVTNTKPQQNITPTVTKPKQKCPVSDPLCGIF